MASPLVLALLTAVVAEVTAADAVTGESIAATEGDAGVFFPFFSCLWWFTGKISEVHLASGSSTIL